eukprot:10997390-Alexandrium_andersonii.AAC.1
MSRSRAACNGGLSLARWRRAGAAGSTAAPGWFARRNGHGAATPVSFISAPARTEHGRLDFELYRRGRFG